MPQKTNLNINPYYDDFTDDKNFHKVLFRPGRPVQARELTSLQSIAQNQIEKFGRHIFKDGAMVIPGNLNYDPEYYSVRLDSEHLGLPVSLYVKELKGKILKGQNSGIKVVVIDYKLPSDSTDITDLTLFIKYKTGSTDNTSSELLDGEVLIAEETIVYGNTTIDIGDTVATLVSLNAAATGSAVSIGSGVYFIRGNFVEVTDDTVVLDPYSNTPSYRVGFNVLESIVTAKDDASLYDNARGFSNYAAPGADRLKISTTLTKKSLTDFNDTSFIELVRVENGELKRLIDSSQYSIIDDYISKRTFEESGNYSLDNFDVHLSESLNDNISNGGIYQSSESTQDGNTPSEDTFCTVVSSGKAYVKGHRIVSVGSSVIDVDKPRDTQTISSGNILFKMGNLLRVNNVSGTPLVGINNDSNVVTLHDQRKNSTTSGTGIGIGTARVYSCGLRNSAYSDAASEWDLYLYDIQTYTQLTLNSGLSASQCPATSYIKGKSSGASGYVNLDAAGTSITLSETSGKFIVGEQILINGLEENSRTIGIISAFGAEDIRSVYQNTSSFTGFSTDFVADTVLRDRPILNNSQNLQINVDGTNLTSPGAKFSTLKIGSIIKYQIQGDASPRFNRVKSVTNNGATVGLEAVSNVSGVCVGGIGVGTVTASLAAPEIVNDENAGLYIPLDNTDVSDVSLSNSTLGLAEQIGPVTPSSGALTLSIPTGISSAFFVPFDTQHYSVSYFDGSTEDLTSDQFKLINNFTQIELSGLDNKECIVNVTLEKNSISNKDKQFIRSTKLNVTRCRSGVTTSSTGMTQNDFYGLRVEDEEISLNVPDVSEVIAVYESKDANAPIFDKLVFVSGLGLDTNTILGERIVGSESKAIAQLVTRSGANNVEICYLNDNKFKAGEEVTFSESNIVTIIQSIELGTYLDISDNYILNKGQKEQFYDYSRIVRRKNTSAPTKKLTIVYNHYTIPSSDTGDVFTVNSYDSERYLKDIPSIGGVRASDTIDFRPRVSEFTSSVRSPFADSSRQYSASGATATRVPAPNSSTSLSYSFYLPRIDKLVLGKDGVFSVTKGVSSLTPSEPSLLDGSMHIATMNLPAYLYRPSDADIKMVDNKRYTMRDIARIDERVSNLEETTSLSLLELDIKTLQVQDATGDRFKTGFFVDDFKDAKRLDRDNPDCNMAVDMKNSEMIAPLDFYTFKPEIALKPSYDTAVVDWDDNPELLDSNVQKTGDLITLKYEEKDWIKNPFASRVENVNPFNIIVFRGRMTLSPSSDNWVREVSIRGEDRITQGRRMTWEEVEAGVSNETRYEKTIDTPGGSDPYIHSRNVGFSAGSLKAFTTHYSFFDARSGIDIIPKLIEVSMQSGSFEKGETVVGLDSDGNKLITFRLAQANHKTGNFMNPDTTYSVNPYDQTINLASIYSSSSTVLNVDITSLANIAQSTFIGRLESDLRLVGETSKAEAIVSNIRLVSDTVGELSGAFFIRNPNGIPTPSLRFPTGTSSFKVTASSTNKIDVIPGDEVETSLAETDFITSGSILNRETFTVVVRRPPPRPRHDDPLAQSFWVDETGAFLSSIDLYFYEIDDEKPLTVQIRTVELGIPTNQVVQDFAEVTIDPSQLDSSGNSVIKTSADASVATNIKFPSPVYLEAGQEYAIVLLATDSVKYKVWTSVINDVTIETKNLAEGSQNYVNSQYIGGSIFKSQNGTIWTPNQEQDLKFTLYKCEFITNQIGEAIFYNPPLENEDYNFKSLNNSIKTYPRKLKVGITTNTNMGSILVPGRKVTAADSSAPSVSVDAKGIIESVGSQISNVGLRNGGVGYKGGGSYSNVNLVTLSGSGIGAKGTFQTTVDGAANILTITTPGNGYAVGDVVGITTADLGTDKKGTGAEFTITSIQGIDTLYLTNVQGEKFTDDNYLCVYNDPTDDSSITAGAATTIIEGDSSVISGIYTGNVLEVTQYSHAMTADNNKVVISGIQPDTIPIKLNSQLDINGSVISVASTSEFTTFEGISTSQGYVKIGQEIIYYNGIGDGTLTVGSRAYGTSYQQTHGVNSQCFKYEFNGISLTGINTTHDLPSDSSISSLRTIDKYHVYAARGARENLQDRSSGANQVSFIDESFGGGRELCVTQNFQYESFIPSFNVLAPGKDTSINAKLRSVSGTSDGGTESSFIDKGYEDVSFNNNNKLTSPRLLCSKVNEVSRLTNLPKNRSVTLIAQLHSKDKNLSPVIDTMSGTFRLTRNRLNSPITNYTKDNRTKLVIDDPHSAVYISQKVNLKNPATSLKVLLAAYRHPSADFRVLYRLFKSSSSEIEPSYELFPGYDNLKDEDIEKVVIDSNLNSGRADTIVPPSEDNQFLEYEYNTWEDVGEFIGFQIKIVSTGTNEAYPPRYQDIRVIATI